MVLLYCPTTGLGLAFSGLLSLQNASLHSGFQKLAAVISSPISLLLVGLPLKNSAVNLLAFQREGELNYEHV